jgi:methionine sulfoxide reductase catalytic subunit
MWIRRPAPGASARIKSSELTSESVYLNRRQLLQAAAIAGLTGVSGLASTSANAAVRPLKYSRNEQFSTTETPNSYEDVTTYNNYYEFGTGKSDPAQYSGDFKPEPWSVTVSGEAEVTGKFNLEDFIGDADLEERIYRLRCVEAWSMVIPWTGVPLATVLKRYKPTSKAKFVAFKTVYRPTEMPGLRSPVLRWPYVEGLRIDEAMHPLALLAVGIYGQSLPNQNGAPLRLVTPWKYGFKGIKSIVEIRFTEQQPSTSWNDAASHEYGFYANVNPDVDHPRWSQARERRLGSGVFAPKVPTQMFNGYADEVGELYANMDLRRAF